MPTRARSIWNRNLAQTREAVKRAPKRDRFTLAQLTRRGLLSPVQKAHVERLKKIGFGDFSFARRPNGGFFIASMRSTRTVMVRLARARMREHDRRSR